MTRDAGLAVAPGGLRLVFVAVFAGLAVVAVSAASGEWTELFASLRAPYSPGEAPRPLALLGSGEAALAACFATARALTARRTPLAVPAGVLAGVVLTVVALLGPAPSGRNWARADLGILGTGRGLHAAGNEQLQKKGEVPHDAASWQAWLSSFSPGDVPVRERVFGRLSYRVVRVKDAQSQPDPSSELVPGTLLVWVSPDGAQFSLRMVGLGPQRRAPTLLVDERGQTLELRGTFNPQRAATGKGALP